MCSMLALPTDIRLRRKWLAVTNALTYSAAVLDTYLNVVPFYMYICSILALPTNIRLRRKWLAVTTH
jgi:hypothetical protein